MVFAYLVLAARIVYVQIIAGPTVAQSRFNPRIAMLEPYRGPIVARDGMVLASSTAHGRAYPFGAATAHVVGYRSARYGVAGLESAYADALAARAAPANPIAQIAALLAGHTTAPQRGATVITTIDPAVEATLATALAPYPRAAGVVLDPRSGDVLAIASVPSFDPAAIDTAFPALATDATSPLLDRALDGLYPPGSTWKVFTAATALDDGTVSLDSRFDDPGYFQVGAFVVHDDEGEATGNLDLTSAFARSSNVDFARIALAIGSAPWFAAADRWGLGSTIPFELAVERDRLPPERPLPPGILAQLGFGQADLLVTPMRMALVAATIATGGRTPRPRLVRALRVSGHDEVQPQATLASPISATTATEVGSMMRAVVARGTGTAAAVAGITVAGKTGTATNAAGRPHAWFIAFAPADAPRVAVAVVVEHAGYGGVVAAPIAGRVIAAALHSARP